MYVLLEAEIELEEKLLALNPCLGKIRYCLSVKAGLDTGVLQLYLMLIKFLLAQLTFVCHNQLKSGFFLLSLDEIAFAYFALQDTD